MKRPDLPLEGACRCGRTRLRITLAPIMTAACHCRGCQRMSASAFSLTAMIPVQGLEVLEGETVRGGLGGPTADHRFCPHCLSWMFTYLPGIDDFVNLRPTMLDDASWFEPFIETCTAEKLPWATTSARHRFEGFPPMEKYLALIEEFAGALD